MRIGYLTSDHDDSSSEVPMPIYEFYCPACHVVFNFLARSVNTEKQPDCPRCQRPELERQVSLFAISKGRKEESDDLPGDFDEAKMERAMEAMAGEFEGIDEEDPRQAARLMRKLYDATGMKLGAGIEEAIRRMEAGPSSSLIVITAPSGTVSLASVWTRSSARPSRVTDFGGSSTRSEKRRAPS